MGHPAAHLSMCQHLSFSAEEMQSAQDNLPEEVSKYTSACVCVCVLFNAMDGFDMGSALMLIILIETLVCFFVYCCFWGDFVCLFDQNLKTY